jgi:Kef-type K+ transport system membrane component KefB
VVVQIVTGILLGPGVLGAAFPAYYAFVFTPAVVQALNGVAWWAVMLFVWIAGIELDLRQAWRTARDRHHRRPGAGRAAAAGLRVAALVLLPWPRLDRPAGRSPGSSCWASAWPAR